MEITTYAGPIAITLAYVAVYYAFQGYQLRVKTRLASEYRERGEKFDRYFNQDRTMLAADRVVLNTVEHMGPFLALLWLYAVFVGPQGATIGGGIYVAARAAYPFVLGRRLGRGVPLRIFASTFVGYGVLSFFMIGLGWALLAGG